MSICSHDPDAARLHARKDRGLPRWVLGLVLASAILIPFSPATANRLTLPIEPYTPTQEFLIGGQGFDRDDDADVDMDIDVEVDPDTDVDADVENADLQPATEAESQEVTVAESPAQAEPAPEPISGGDAGPPSDVDADLEPSLEEPVLQADLEQLVAPSLRNETFPSRFAGLLVEPAEGNPPKALVMAQQRLDTILIVRDPKVDRHIQYFNDAIRDRFHTWLMRLGRYRPMVESVFAEFGLPLDLAYLSLVESGFNPRAYSRARATGPWQFMKGTARLYGLKVNWWVDERRDPIKSTVAAARYLRDLYDLFGSWPLAMAAYNAGEGRVGRALRKTDSESFYEIARSRYIRRETKEYVPRFMAATIIAKNPDQYGFPSFPPDPHQFEEVTVSRPLHLRDIAKATHIAFGELRSLNPELRRYVTPPNDKEYHLKVPVGTKDKVESVLDQIPSYKKSTPPRLKRGQKVPKGWYRVRWGDSLWKIAKRFRTSVRELMAINNLRSIRIKPGDLLAIRP